MTNKHIIGMLKHTQGLFEDFQTALVENDRLKTENKELKREIALFKKQSDKPISAAKPEITDNFLTKIEAFCLANQLPETLLSIKVNWEYLNTRDKDEVYRWLCMCSNIEFGQQKIKKYLKKEVIND